MSAATPTELSVQGESIQQLYNDHTASKYLVNRRYQRKLVWGVEEKERLIDSVVQKLPIPLILLAESSGEHLGRLEVIDGLQRLNSVFSFIENEFPWVGTTLTWKLWPTPRPAWMMEPSRKRSLSSAAIPA